MDNHSISLDELKHKIRKLKQMEKILRSQNRDTGHAALVWDSFFDLRDEPDSKAKYTLHTLSAMNRDEYRAIIDEYFAFVYYEIYKESESAIGCLYDPSILAQLGLPFNAEERDVKKRFRELAKQYHPDAGGDAVKFIELMKVYEKLVTG